jgi:hypothetical protein
LDADINDPLNNFNGNTISPAAMKAISLLVLNILLTPSALLASRPVQTFVQSADLQQTLTEEQKIERLIKYIAGMRNAVFIRNGSEHSPSEAAEHLKLKRKKAGSSIKTAREFIEKCATKSSMTGEAYSIKFADGRQRRSREVLTEELARIESTPR